MNYDSASEICGVTHIGVQLVAKTPSHRLMGNYFTITRTDLQPASLAAVSM